MTTTDDAQRVQEIMARLQDRWYSAEQTREDVRYLLARLEALEAERDVYRDALTLISRGVWTARNSVESIVWGARDALKKGAALAGSREQATGEGE